MHRFDMDERYAYISTEIAGLRRQHPRRSTTCGSARPEEVRAGGYRDSMSRAARSRPGPAGATACTTRCARRRALGGLLAAGVRVIDISDIRKPRTLGEYNYHPPFPEPTHTFMPVPVAVSTAAASPWRSTRKTTRTRAEEMERRRGRPHGCLWVFDVSELKDMKPLAIFEVSELDSPWSRAAPGPLRAHQFQEHIEGHARLLRLVRRRPADRRHRRSAGAARSGPLHPEPAWGARPAPQTNDVDVDSRAVSSTSSTGWVGFDVLQFVR